MSIETFQMKHRLTVVWPMKKTINSPSTQINLKKAIDTTAIIANFCFTTSQVIPKRSSNKMQTLLSKSLFLLYYKKFKVSRLRRTLT